MAGPVQAGITGFTCTQQADNSMRYDCAVSLDEPVTVSVGFRPSAGGPWKWSHARYGDATTPVEVTLYNFEPDVAHTARAKILGSGSGTLTMDTSLGTPTLPADLGNLLFTRARTGGATRYVLFDTKDCDGDTQYLVVYDVVNGHISWYHDVTAATGAAGGLEWSYFRDADWIPADPHPQWTILAVVDRMGIYEWDWTGKLLYSDTTTFTVDDCGGAAGDVGPCGHHDVHRSKDSDYVYALTAYGDTSLGSSTCPSVDGYIDEGFQVWDPDFAPGSSWRFVADLGWSPPDVDHGPPPPGCSGGHWAGYLDGTFADWMHNNSIDVANPDPGGPGDQELVTVSSRQWSTVIRVNATATPPEVLWILDGDANTTGRGAFTIENGAGITESGSPTNFGGQHHVTDVQGNLLMFDNRTFRADNTDARAIYLELTPGSPGVATIERSWVMRTLSTDTPSNGPLTCTAGRGSAVVLPNTGGANVLALCGPSAIIEELDESDGGIDGDPLLYLKLGQGSPADYCSDARTGVAQGWYRAWPLLGVGEF